MKARLFGTSGIRGKTNVDINPELVFQVSAIYAITCRGRSGAAPAFVVGHDQRYGAKMLALSAIAGANSRGAHVIYLGCVSTGQYCAYLRSGDFAGGIYLTGSHMAPERIGLILTLGNGHYADRDVTDVVEQRLAEYPANCLPVTDFQKIGEVTAADQGEVAAAYLGPPFSALHSVRHAVRMLEPRILLDPGNGTAGAIARALLTELGCIVDVINAEPLPIPNRRSECKPENCGEAIACTRDGGYTLGACFDGDADRVKFILPDGTMLSDDVVAASFAMHLLQPGEVYVTPVNASGLVRFAVESRGGRLVECRIGQPATDTEVRQHSAAMASESNAGKFGFAELGCCYDGPFAVAKMLGIMAQTGKSLAELISELPRFFQAEVSIPVDDARKAAVTAAAIAAVRTQLGEEVERVDTTDGTKFYLRGERWLLLRPSGTEPLVRAYSDGRSQEQAQALVALAQEEFRRALS